MWQLKHKFLKKSYCGFNWLLPILGNIIINTSSISIINWGYVINFFKRFTWSLDRYAKLVHSKLQFCLNFEKSSQMPTTAENLYYSKVFGKYPVSHLPAAQIAFILISLKNVDVQTKIAHIIIHKLVCIYCCILLFILVKTNKLSVYLYFFLI